MRIYTSNKADTGFDDKVLHKVLAAVECIGALPIPMKTKSYLIGAKAIPAITYGAHISKITKHVLQRVQGSVVKALWKNRPMARSRWLVLTFHGKPHRIDPVLASAYNCLLEVFRFCFHEPSAILTLRRLWGSRDTLKHSLVMNIAQACSTLGLQVDQELRIRFHHSAPLQVGACAPHDVAPALQQIVQQCAYSYANTTTRKDFCQPTGLLDVYLPTLFARKPTTETPGDVPATVRFESVLVGCTLTRDRLAAAGWCDSSACRFCGQDKETLHHLTYPCQTFHSLTSTPVLHEQGPNFPLLGHVEHPFRLTAFRLLHQAARIDDAASLDPAADPLEVWTDGSVLWQENFWLTTATFAVIAKNGTLLHSGRVQRWCLSSYVAELWAVWSAFSSSAAPICVYCDNQAVVRNVQYMIQHDAVKVTWKCLDWWQTILALHRIPLEHVAKPLDIQWIPAHMFEDTPIHMLCPRLVAEAGTTIEHVTRNREADQAAKALAAKVAPVYPDMVKVLSAAAVLHQEWLVRLHAHLDTSAEGASQDRRDEQATVDHFSLTDARRQFPKWEWGAVKSLHTWKPKIPEQYPPPKRWRYQTSEWDEICKFARQLRWRSQPNTATSFCELGVFFHSLGYRCAGDYDSIAIHSVVCKIWQAFQFFAKDDRVDAFPGIFDPRFVKSAGKVLPQSAVVGAVPLSGMTPFFL